MRFASVAVPFVLLATPAAAQSAFDGNWKVDVGNARLDPKPDVLLLKDGRYSCSSCAPPYAVAADGQFHPIPGHPYADAISLAVTGPRTVVEKDRKNGKVVIETTTSVSADGATLSMRFTDTSAPNGKVVTGSQTEARVGPAPPGAHAISGAWRPGKVTGMSDDGLRFTIHTRGDEFHYATPTGQRVDGRIGGGYVKEIGDLGDTMIKYERIDARTLRSTSMRAGKVTDVTTITALPDGRTLTADSHDLLHNTNNTYRALRE